MAKKYVRIIDFCDCCPMFFEGIKRNICEQSNRKIEDIREIPDWCPLEDAEVEDAKSRN